MASLAGARARCAAAALTPSAPLRPRFPVCLYLPRSFPADAPLCFLRPVPGMFVAAGHPHADASGRIYHPYLAA